LIVGNNSMNKNDLMDVISGVQTLTSGKIHRKSNLKIGVSHSILHNYYS
jgi:ATPase subunit of ABC transporter with duplicated ATPase domains